MSMKLAILCATSSNCAALEAEDAPLAVPMLLALAQGLPDLRAEREQAADLEGHIATDGVLLASQGEEFAQPAQRRVSRAGFSQEERRHPKRPGGVQEDQPLVQGDFVSYELGKYGGIENAAHTAKQRDVI